MTATFSFGSDSTFGFDDILEALRNSLSSASAITTSPTSFVLNDGTDTFTVTGTGFTYSVIGGQTYLTVGTIESFEMDRLGTTLGTISSLSLSASLLSAAVLDELFGFDPLALENLVLTPDWAFEGTNGADILTDDMISPDGVAIAPSGNDVAYLYGGNDIFAGGLGDDSIFGGSGQDQLFGGDGNDYLNGGSGRDQLFGGAGDDVMYGAGAKDLMRGGFGEDTMYGGSDDDEMHGEAGKDLMYGDGGDDLMFGGAQGGTDRMYGGDGNDTMFGGNARDKMYGDAGNDTLNGDLGNDQMFGGTGDDFLFGGAGDDRMYGGEGTNVLDGGIGDDRLYGGTDADTFVFNETSGTDRVFNYDIFEDTIEITGTGFVSITILADTVVLNHTGGTITIEDTSITTAAEYTALLDSFDLTFNPIIGLDAV